MSNKTVKGLSMPTARGEIAVGYYSKEKTYQIVTYDGDGEISGSLRIGTDAMRSLINMANQLFMSGCERK